jgi:hypothetical protein
MAGLAVTRRRRVTMRQLLLSLGLWSALILPAAAAPSSVVIPQATVVRVRLLQALSSKTAQVGDRVRVRVDDNDRSGLPHGAVLVGRVTEVQRASDSQPGILDLSFGALEQSGQWQSVSGSLCSLNPADVQPTGSGRLVAKKGKGNQTKFIGYGALGGVVLGKLLHTSTIKGVLLGAAAGYLYGRTQKDKNRDVDLKEGAEFGVRLDQRLTLRTDTT